jgi:8-oxo-dGTP pyrophosphatase MutT (NUDIX family)
MTRTRDKTTVRRKTTAGKTRAVRTTERFELLARLGGGGQSDVYRAKDAELGRFVAVKFLRSRDADAQKRMKREGVLLARLQHPSICPIYDIGEHPTRGLYLVLELLEGGTLRDVMNSGPVAPPRIVQIVHDVAAALQAAHAAGVLHRDVKPENVAVLPDSTVKLFDFGVAKVVGGATTGHFRLGTLGYMSPEQFAGDGVSDASDVFSLGCVFYELLAGKLPFEKGAELMRGHYDPLPVSVSAELGNAAVDLLVRMLNADARARPAASDVVSALESVQHDLELRQKNAQVDTARIADFVGAIPAEDMPPILVARIAANHGLVYEEALAALRMPLIFGALLCTVDPASNGLLVRAATDVARYFLKSLSIYLRYGLTLIEDWDHREDSARADSVALLGADFVYAMEQRRVFRYGIVQPIRFESPSQVVIKAYCSLRRKPVYLVQYDRFAQQYQLIGGRSRDGETPIATIEREIGEELSGNDLRPGRDYRLEFIERNLVVTQLSRTVGAFTQYHFSIFKAQFERPIKLGDGDRWVTEEELFLGKLDDGSRMPWNDHLARVANALPRGLDSLPYSFSQPIQSRSPS